MSSLTIYDQLGTELERHPIACGSTLHQWLSANVDNYADLPLPPFVAQVNGQPLPPQRFDAYAVGQQDDIELTLRARDPVTGTIIALTALAIGVAVYTYANLPDTDYQKSTPDGQSAYNLSIRANRARVNGIIPHVAGSFPRFPDLITSIRRAYESHREVIYLAFSLGAGRYNTNGGHVYISDTPLSSYNDSSAVAFYDPGADISGDDAAQNWYTNNEIGGSRGSGGLELKYEPADEEVTYDFIGEEIYTYDDSGDPIVSPLDVDDTIYIVAGDDELTGFYLVTAKGGFSPFPITVEKLLSSSAVDVDPAWPGFGSDGFLNQEVLVYQYPPSSAGDWSNWYTVAPDAEGVHALEVDYRFPQGLVRSTNKGKLKPLTVQWELEVDYDGGNETFTIEHTDATRDVRQYTWRDDYGTPRTGMRVRFRRLTLENGDIKYTEKLEIVRVKARLEQNDSYADITAMTLKLVGTNTLAASSENQINIRGDSRLLPTLANLKSHLENATALTYSATSSIARFVAWTLFEQLGSDALNALDWDRASELETLWASRGDELNGEFTDETTLWEALKLMLAPGMTEPLPREGRVTFVRNAESTVDDAAHFYTPDVMLGEGLNWSESWYNDAEPDGIDVEYIDGDTGKAVIIECRLPGDLGLKPKRIQLIGVTDSTQAWRWGMRERRRLFYKPGTLTFETELDALNSLPGDIIALASDLDVEQYGVVVDFSVDTFTTERALDFQEGETYYCAFRQPNGRLSGLYEVEQGSTAYEMVLTNPSNLNFTPVTDPGAEPTLYSMGKESEWGTLGIVREITPAGFADGRPQVTVTAEEYVAEIYADDDNTPGG